MVPPSFHERLQALGRQLRGAHPLVRLRAVVLIGVGWLLSPLCWWNDLVINLPLAYGFARLVQHWRPDAFAAGLVVGYWLSNVVGILLMQSGALQILTDSAGTDDEGGAAEGELAAAAPRHDRRRELLMGLATSSLYTLAVVLLVKLGVLEGPLAGLMPEAAAAG
ncbi:hypothetical protein NZK33_17435 [Cyanobium sp. FGCU-6]|nr:hypothetical protein [Cyanobium sp. FGCU6]